jgi:hypothetical protein
MEYCDTRRRSAAQVTKKANEATCIVQQYPLS